MRTDLGNRYRKVLDRILHNNTAVSKHTVRKILIIYDADECYIGDTCIMFDRFKICKLFFGESVTVDVNCVNKKYLHIYEAFGKNNPYLDNVFSLYYNDIAYGDYDVVIAITYDESRLVREVHDQYAGGDMEESLNVAIFSFSELLLFARHRYITFFPVHQELLRYAELTLGNPCEVYVSGSETDRANTWLESNGMKNDERLIVLLDSASDRGKLLKIDVYFDVLQFFLKDRKNKILIFDEKNIGKRAFYREWLGDDLINRFIFSTSMPFMDDLALLSSQYISAVFGPCTGLMHCASGIHNHFARNGRLGEKHPLLITYTGPWDAYTWWGNAPLVNCLILNGDKQLQVLHELDDKTREFYIDRSGCNEYTSEMLIGFMQEKLTRSRESAGSMGDR